MPAYHLFLIADAAAFFIIFFKGVEAVLLISDGVYSASQGLCIAAIWTIALLGLAMLNARRFPEWSQRKALIIVVVEIAGFVLMLYGAWRFASTPPQKDRDTLWIANQWRMLPKNWWLMGKLSPGWAAIQSLMAAFLIYLLATLRMRWLTLLAMCGIIYLVYGQIMVFPYGDKMIVYLVVFLGPLIIAALAAAAFKPRLFSRTIAGCVLGLLIFWTYAGLIPSTPPSGFEALPGVDRIYPPPGTRPDFPLTFMRDIELDPIHNAIFTTYGSACGVVKFDLASGKTTVLEEKGLIRFLRTDPEENYIYGSNWDLQNMVVITKDPFAIVHSQDMFKGEVLALWDHVLDGKYHFVGTTEYAGIGKYVRDRPGGPLRRIAFLNFHKMGLMKFKSGAFGIARDPATRRIYIEAGMLDTTDRYIVLAINPDTMKIEKSRLLPEGGLELTFIPEHNALIAASFFSRRLFELDAKTLAIRRSFMGPLNSRNVVYDAKRDLIYALGFLEGRLYVLRYSDMQILLDIPVGKRPNALALWPEKNTLFVGSSEGLFRIDLNAFLSRAILSGGKNH